MHTVDIFYFTALVIKAVWNSVKQVRRLQIRERHLKKVTSFLQSFLYYASRSTCKMRTGSSGIIVVREVWS